MSGAGSSLFLAALVLKAAAVLLLMRIAAIDFRIQKIFNTQLLQLLALALGLQVIAFARTSAVLPVLVAAAAAIGIFAILLPFWLAGKVGAGDVKLLTVTPLLVGQSGSFAFMVALLFFALATYSVMKFPMLLPERWFRGYVKIFAASGRVPFGVPTSAAAITAILVSTGS